MTKTTAFLSCLLTILLLHSCTAEKRLYRPGFHIEWNKRYISEREEAEPVTKEQVVIHSSEVAFSDSTRQEQYVPEESEHIEQSDQIVVQQQSVHSEQANQMEKATHADQQTLMKSVQEVKYDQHVVPNAEGLRRAILLFFLIFLLIIILFIVLAFVIGLDTFWGVFFLVIGGILFILFILAARS